MERSVLIAVDGSHNSLQPARYVARTFGQVPDFKATLLTVIKAPPPFLIQEAKTDAKALTKLKQLQAKIKKGSQAVLDKAKEEMARAGMPGERIGQRAIPTTTGLAKDIVFEAQNGLFDALVVGRRGLGMVQEMLLGSISQQVVDLAKSVPVWIVDGEPAGEGVLLALDGSEDSFKAVDHVGFILAGHPRAHVVLVHVSTALADYCVFEDESEPDELELELLKKEEDYCMTNYFTRAIKMLTEAGVAKDRIEVEFRVKRLDLARTILKVADEVEAGSVVLGRRGLSRLKGLLLGSVSNKIIQSGRHRSVWVVA